MPPVKTWQAGTLTYSSIGIGFLFFWLLWGDFAWSMKERSAGAVAALMLRSFGTSDMLLGLLMGSLPNAIGMILGPVISYRSDRHRGPRGRRLPYLLVTTPIAVLGMVGLALSPWLGRTMQHFLGTAVIGLDTAILIFFGLSWVTFEFATVIANAIFIALINDVVPRGLLGRFFALFRALSLLSGIFFNFYLLGKAEEHYMWVFIGIAVLYGAGFSIMCLKVKEGEYPPPNDPEHARGFSGAAKLYFQECFSNRYYCWVFGAYSLCLFAFVPLNTFSLFYAKSLDMSIDFYGKLSALTFVISFFLAYLLGILSDRFHPLRMAIAVIGVYAVVMLLCGILVTGPASFGAAMVAHGVTAGAFYTATASYGQMLFPKARFAQFNSALALLSAIGFTLAPAVIGMFLDSTGHIYRYTFFMGAGMAALGMLACMILYNKFMAMGGPARYQAPE
ncbi:MAG: MFS transporter [Lentisphaerota bacterium]